MKVDHLSDAELAARPHRVRGPAMDALLAARAIAPGMAAGYAPADPAAARDLARRRTEGVVRANPDGRLWYDLRRHYAVENARSVQRAWIAGVVALVLAGVAVLLY